MNHLPQFDQLFAVLFSRFQNLIDVRSLRIRRSNGFGSAGKANLPIPEFNQNFRLRILPVYMGRQMVVRVGRKTNAVESF